MEQVQEMHAQHAMQDQFSVYPPVLQSYNATASSFVDHSGQSRERFLPSDPFGPPHRHDQHEAEHVYDSPQLTLDPSTLDLRSNSSENPRSSSANTSGSNSTTPTGSLRLSAFAQPNISTSGVTTRRKARAALEQLQVQIQAGGHPEVHPQLPHQHQDQHQHQQSDMQSVHMHGGEVQMHVDDCNNHGMIGSGIGHEQAQGDSMSHQMYAMLSDTTSQTEYYLASGTFPASSATVSTPPDASPSLDLQANSSSMLTAAGTSSMSMSRAFRPNPLSLAIAGRSMPLVPMIPAHGTHGQQQLSPSHLQHTQLSSHPHMYPPPYYPLPHGAGSPGFPSTPTTSHHTQGSSSSSHSSGRTRHSLHGSSGPRGFGRGHTRSDSYGTASTMSVRSSSPASSVASAFTSLSGGGGSTPASTSGPIGSPSSYGEGGEVQIPFANASPRNDGSHHSDNHPARSQSHPPLSMPTAHSTLAAYSAFLPQTGKGLLQQRPSSYAAPREDHIIERSRESTTVWPPPSHTHANLPSPSLGGRVNDDVQGQLPPKSIVTRTSHRKQKLANSDRKAICMYAKQHPSARQEDIAARYNVERSTISKILKNKERWLGCPDDDAKVARKRKPRFDDLELVLKTWVEGTKPQGIVLSDALIRSKAKEEARRLGILEDKFKASSGWLENFKHRVGIRKGRYIGREPWQEASDSEGESSLLTTKQVQEQKMVWSTNPTSSSEQLTRGLWPAAMVQGQLGETAQIKNQEAQPPMFQDTSDHVSSAQPTLTELDPDDDYKQQCQGSSPHPASRQEGRKVGVGMRKTRSRTLAEAREAEAVIHGGFGSSSPSTSSPTSLSTVPVLAPAAHIEPNPRQGFVNSLAGLSHSASPISSSPATIDHPDGREASAGLDAALDFIGCQPQGFATPEELAVLKKLSRRMSRAELPRHVSTSAALSPAWNETGET